MERGRGPRGSRFKGGGRDFIGKEADRTREGRTEGLCAAG